MHGQKNIKLQSGYILFYIIPRVTKINVSRGLLKISVFSSSVTNCVCIRTTGQLMLFMEIIADCCENSTKHVNALRWRT